MQSRSKKFRKSFNSYEEAIEKQLNDDFQVSEYLGQNQIDGNNIDEYLKLYDSLLVTKQEKIKKSNTLRVNHEHMNSENRESSLRNSQMENWGGTRDEFQRQYELIQISSLNEHDIKNNLQKEIVETKKSLNLLKGDIGHLVGRNESAKLLESKMSKVKIVADDQFKRVSLAYSKDKEEIKLRSEMQKKFGKKLKNVSSFEATCLTKMKRNYISSMVKKKAIHDRLNHIEKVGQSVNGTGHIERQKNLNNNASLDRFIYLSKVCTLISRVPEYEKSMGNSSDEINHFVQWLKDEQNYYSNEQLRGPIVREVPSSSYKSSRSMLSTVVPNLNSEDLEIIESERLVHFEGVIRREYNRIIQEIQKNTKIYNIEMKKNQEAVEKLEKLEQEMDKVFAQMTDEYGRNYCVTPQVREAFSQKMGKFLSFLRTLFILLEYLEKSVNYSSICPNTHNIRRKSESDSQKSIKEKPLKLEKKMTFSVETDHLNLPSEYRCRSSSERSDCEQQQSLSGQLDASPWEGGKNYISELHKCYYELLKESQEISSLSGMSPSLFDYLQDDIRNWLGLILEYYKSGVRRSMPLNSMIAIEKQQSKNCKPRRQISKVRESRALPTKTPKVETEEEEVSEFKDEEKFVNSTYLRHHTVYREDSIHRPHSFSKTNSGFSMTQNNLKHSGVFNKTMKQLSFDSEAGCRIANVNKLKRISHSGHKDAQRIQLLENIDKDYYKMLKSTIQMEKENTRKNYQFLRTFKRAKYSSRDEILEQKRFQSSFSMLFLDKGVQKPLKGRPSETETKKSHFFKKNSESMNSSMIGQMPILSKNNSLIDDSRICKRSSGFLFENKLRRSDSRQSKENSIDKSKVNCISKYKKANNLHEIKGRRSSQPKMKEILNLV